MPSVARIALVLAITALAPGLTVAQEPAAAKSLAIELNALQPSDNGCRVTFVVTNNLGATLDLATAEVALFNTDRAIDRIVKLDFKNLTDGKSKVLQFNVPSLDCQRVGRLLINDITACQGEGIAPDACLADLQTSAIPEVTFGV